jgi:ABC-2 type transport system permease protein
MPTFTRTGATSVRVLTQLIRDPRTIVLLLAVPSLLIALLREVLGESGAYDRVAVPLMVIFPFVMMFLITSVVMLRERQSGTLERLLTTPLAKVDLLLGYGLAFAVAAALQAVVTVTVAYTLLDLNTEGSPVGVVGVAVADAVLGTALGLLISAFANTEFQAVQAMPAVIMPQILVCGLFVPREQMAGWLQAIGDVLPLSFAVDALQKVASGQGDAWGDITVVIAVAVAALVAGAATLRRRTG